MALSGLAVGGAVDKLSTVLAVNQTERVPSSRIFRHKCVVRSNVSTSTATECPHPRTKNSRSTRTRRVRVVKDKQTELPVTICEDPSPNSSLTLLDCISAVETYPAYPDQSRVNILPFQESDFHTSNLERSFLEAQWALAISDPLPKVVTDDLLCYQEAGLSHRRDSVETFIEGNVPPKVERPSARQRRLRLRNDRLAAVEPSGDPDLLKLFPFKNKMDKAAKQKVSLTKDNISGFLKHVGRLKLLTREEEVSLGKKLQASLTLGRSKLSLEKSLGREATIDELASYVALSKSEMRKVQREGEMAKHKMIATNLRLVVSVAKNYSRYGLDIADLIQAGNMGLVKGIEKFDPTRGYKLSTYAHWWIRQAVTRVLADQSRTIRVPLHVHETLGRIRRAKAEIISRGEKITMEKLCSSLQMSERKVSNALQSLHRLRSFDEEIKGNNASDPGLPLHEFVPDKESELKPWITLERRLLKEDVIKLLSSLNPREQEIVQLHFGVGVNAGASLTLDSISQRFGVSRERVRQIETAAIRKLRVLIQHKELDRYCY